MKRILHLSTAVTWMVLIFTGFHPVLAQEKLIINGDFTANEKLLALLSVKETPSMKKEEFFNLLKAKYKELTDKYQDPDTGLIYCETVRELKEERNNTVSSYY